MNERISVMIPTLDAEQTIGPLLEMLQRQTRVPDEVWIVDSASTDRTVEKASAFAFVRVLPLRREDFDHGGTRDMALRASTGDIVLFLTQDALPENERYVERLAQSVAQPEVACACGRQIARADAPLYEKYTRTFNYPAESFLRDASDIPRLGIKAYFLSDVCSAYRRDAYLAVGGFDRPIPTNEDMLIAAKFLRAGFKIAYCAEAAVLHSHHYSVRQEYARNYKIGMVLEQYKERLHSASAESEGIRYVRFVLSRLLRHGAIGEAFRFCLLCGAKVLGSRSGRKAGRQMKNTDIGA